MKYNKIILLACIGSTIISAAPVSDSYTPFGLVARTKTPSRVHTPHRSNVRVTKPPLTKAQKYGTLIGKGIAHLGTLASTALGIKQPTKKAGPQKNKQTKHTPSGSENGPSKGSKLRHIKTAGKSAVAAAGGGRAIASSIGSAIALVQQMKANSQSKRDMEKELLSLSGFEPAIRYNGWRHGGGTSSSSRAATSSKESPSDFVTTRGFDNEFTLRDQAEFESFSCQDDWRHNKAGKNHGGRHGEGRGRAALEAAVNTKRALETKGPVEKPLIRVSKTET